MTEIQQRLDSGPDAWRDRMEMLQNDTRNCMFGTVFATKREDINRLAKARGVRKLCNLNGWPKLSLVTEGG